MGQRGGARTGAGRKKVTRSTTPQVAERVLKQQNSEKLWNDIFAANIAHMVKTGDPRRLQDTIVKCECRAYGNPQENVKQVIFRGDKDPEQINLHITLGERMKKAEERVRSGN